MSEFVIELKDLESGPHKVSFPVTPAWIEASLADAELSPAEGAEPGTIDVTAQLTGDDVLVRGQARVPVATPCARCLEPVRIDVEVDLTTLLSRGAPVAPSAADDGEEEDVDLDAMDRDLFVGDAVHLDDLVREHIILEIPMKVVCNDAGGCAGLEIPAHLRPPEDFGNEADPRLAPLEQLKAELEKKNEE